MPTRTVDRRRKRAVREQDRDISISKVSDMSRRRDTLADIFTFLKVYFPSIFSQRFTPDRVEMIEAIIFAARFGGDQGVAAPRGEGKTRNALYCSLWLCLNGKLNFPIIIGKNATRSATDMKSLKEQFQYNDRFSEDFPEVCVPIRELGGWASRARMQTVDGEHTRIEWAADHIILPTVADRDTESAARGQIIASLGIEGPIRGCTYRNQRPDLAIIDDVDDRESAKSFTQTEDRQRIIDQDILGLAGPGKRISRVMLCTLMNRICIAATYTDPKKKPSWRGKRFKALIEKPDRQDLWDEYIRLRNENSEDDPHYRQAHRLYLDNRKAMDAGGVVANPENYDDTIGVDGEPLEVSALQAIYNIIADVGWDNFATEYQNDPPKDDSEETSGITPLIVRQSLNGLEQRIVPNDTQKLAAFIDVGKYRCHYVVIAWRGGSTGYVVDYWEKQTADPDVIGTHKAILTALREWRDERLSEPYLNEDGEPVVLNLCLVDSGYADAAVYEFTSESGAGYMPSMGDSRFRQPTAQTTEKIPGMNHWYRARRQNGIWVVNMDADYWKHLVHDRFLMDHHVDEWAISGCMTLYGKDAKVHGNFARQVCAEIWTREWKEGNRGKVLHDYWKKTHKDNHYLDCMYGACVAASCCGIQMGGDTVRGHRPVVLSSGEARPDGRPW